MTDTNKLAVDMQNRSRDSEKWQVKGKQAMKVGNLVTEAFFGLWGKLPESTKSFTRLWAIFKRKGMIKWSLTKGNVNLERVSGIYLLEEAMYLLSFYTGPC